MAWSQHLVATKTIYREGQQRLASSLRRIRDEAGLTQVQVAERLGRPQSWIARCETAQHRIDIIGLAAIAQALGTDLRAVLDQIDSSPGEFSTDHLTPRPFESARLGPSAGSHNDGSQDWQSSGA